ncbi:hypothetical protein B0J14DRAFT_295725 [Halenospora varia]|nr:hypothetical protein B0J14DRAFT_295725 [Halenospora varia]
MKYPTWSDSGDSKGESGTDHPLEQEIRESTSDGPSQRQRVAQEEPFGITLQPYTETVRNTMQTLATAASAIQKLNDVYSEHVENIEKVPDIHQQLFNLVKECEQKDARIKRQSSTIAELRDLSQEIENEIADRRVTIEADERTLEENKKKLEKKVKDAEKGEKAQKAELELEMKEKKDEKDKEIARLLETLSATTDGLENMKMAKKPYKEEKDHLEIKLATIQNEFVLTAQTEGFHKRHFADIADNIEKTAMEYFTGLPNENPEDIHADLISFDSHFNSIPICQSDTSRDLRIAHTQRIISSALFTHVWQPFSADRILSNSEISTFLEMVATELSSSKQDGTGNRADRVWRILTMREIRSLDDIASADPSPVASTGPADRTTWAVRDMLKILSPLILPTLAGEVEKSLRIIAEAAVEVWNFAQIDDFTITATTALKPSDYDLLALTEV